MLTYKNIISGKVKVTEDSAMKVMAEHTGIDINTPLGQSLWDSAYERGHAYGLPEVCSYFNSYKNIWEAAKKTFQ